MKKKLRWRNWLEMTLRCVVRYYVYLTNRYAYVFYGHVGLSYTRCLQIAGAMWDPRFWICPNCVFKKINFRVGCGLGGSLFRYCLAALYFDVEQSNDKVSAPWELVPCEVCAWTWDVAFCNIIFKISKNNINFKIFRIQYPPIRKRIISHWFGIFDLIRLI